jgi:phosphatidylglycerophosphate synthase
MDFFDGWVARRFHSETSFGAIFDAFADFILVITMSCFLIQMNRIASWFIGLIIVAFIRFILVKPKPESDPLGKHIGTILFIALGLILAIPIPFLAVWSTTIASSYLVISMILSTVMMKRKIKKLI